MPLAYKEQPVVYGLALVKSTWPELWNQSSLENLKAFMLLKKKKKE